MTVIIPSRNSTNLVACLDALYRNEPGIRVIVVDDGLDVQPPGPEYIMGAKPFNFARNCNIGIRAAGGGNAVLLNDDALLEVPYGISLMLCSAIAHTDYGVISSSTNVAVNPAQQRRPGGELREVVASAWPLNTLAFVCVLIPWRTIRDVGLLDERFTAYAWEDVDYCRRVRREGLKLGVHDGCYVDHGSLRSTFRGEPMAPGAIEEGRRIYLEKWGSL